MRRQPLHRSVPYSPIFAWSPLGRYEYDPLESGLVQRPQRNMAIVHGAVRPVTLAGSPALDANGYNFDGNAKYATYPSAGLINTTQGTVVVYYRPNAATAAALRLIWDVRSAAAVGFGFFINTAGNNNTLAATWSGASKATSGNLTWDTSTTYQLALTWLWTGAAYTLTTFRDAVQQGQATDGAALGTLGANMVFGTTFANLNTCDGKQDRPLIYDKALTAAQLGAIR
jgi:hypothetical protein